MSAEHHAWLDRRAPRRTFTQFMDNQQDTRKTGREVLAESPALGYYPERDLRQRGVVPSAADAALGRGDVQARELALVAAVAEPQEVDASGHVLNAPRAIALSTAATRTPERDELGARVKRLALAGQEVDTASIETAVRMILEATGQDLSRADLRETPARVARFYKEFFEWKAGNVETYFDEPVVVDQMVVVADVPVWSICAHHMLPFRTNISMGYIAQGGVLGLSKFPRIALAVAHGLQTQELIAEQIADEIERVTNTADVAVLCAGGEHTCATMRGIRTSCSMSNAVMRGAFRDPATRAEFYTLINRSR